MLVTAVDAYDDGDVKGLVLLPGTKDKLTYQSADWLDNTIRGALFWKDYHSYPVVIPYVLAEWAVQCIVEYSDYEPVSIRYAKPVIHSVDTIPHMYVRLPLGLKLPGLTVDKYARRKATQPHYTKGVQYTFEMSDYMPGCPIIYGARARDIDYAIRCVNESDTPIENLMSSFHWPPLSENEARAACQVLSDYKAWEYFDTCSCYQCAKHLIENNFTPKDI